MAQGFRRCCTSGMHGLDGRILQLLDDGGRRVLGHDHAEPADAQLVQAS
jgi:hypothetical protein